MDPSFFKLMAPFLFANLLTVALVYGYASYARLEREGKERGLEGALRIGATLVALFFLLYGMSRYLA